MFVAREIPRMEVRLMFRLARFAALVSFLGLVLPVPANASIFYATFHGGVGNSNVDSSYLDENAFFGPSGFLLTGDFAATFVLDSDLAGAPLGPIVSTTITVNGHSWNFPGQTASGIFETGGNEFDIEVAKDDGNFFFVDFFSDLPMDLRQVYSSDLHYTGTGYGWLRYVDEPNIDDLAFTATDFTFSMSRVPEPTTWLMLLAGLVFLGIQMRSRRGTVKVRNLLVST
jgi:hypothetical protein